jgi:hypothetical protein
MSIKSHLTSENPLSDDAIEELIDHQEEDKHLDYKETIEQEELWQNRKQWLELTKDFMAFANTEGGYLVFGVEDSKFNITGLSEPVIDTLSEPKLVLEKINKYVNPDFTNIRTKNYSTDDGYIVAVYIPASRGITHVVTKEGSFIYPSDEKEIVLRPGDIYLRRSATNHIVSPEGLNEIINRRIEYYKEKLFDRISRISRVSPERLIEAEEISEEGDPYYLSSDPEATPVKGMSFSTEPNSLEEEIAANIALSQTDPGHEPSDERLWAIYSNRQSLTLTAEMAEWLFNTYLLRNLSFFYWCKFLNSDHIRGLLRESVNQADKLEAKSNIIKTSLLFGERFYRGTVGEFTKPQREHIGYTKDNFHRQNADGEFNQYLIEGMKRDWRRSSESNFNSYLVSMLNYITKELSNNSDRELTNKAISIDFYLYSSFALSSD